MTNTSALPYLLCEIANVHGGDRTHLERMVDIFNEVKYPNKGLKFQVFSAETIALPDYRSFSLYQRLQFDEDTWSTVIDKAKECGDVWLDVFDTYGASILKDNLSNIVGIKLQASIINNLEVRRLLKALDLSGKKLAINVSGFDIDDIRGYVNDFTGLSETLILQVGYQSYPTALEDTGLQKIPVLRSSFPDIPLCFADHAAAETEFAELVPVYAVMMGCNFLEKHICWKRSESPYDAYSSVELEQIQRVGRRLVEATTASSGAFICPAEARYLDSTIQIPIMNKGARQGSLVEEPDLKYRRTSQKGLTFSQISALQKQRMVLGGNIPADSAIDRNDFRDARTAVIVAGRMKSSRLPNKALLPIAGISSIERCLQQCMCVRNIDEVILATSVLDEDAILENHTLDGRVRFFQGDPDDVISRYLGACQQYNVDVIIRVTADCPVVLPEILEYLLQRHFEAGADYTAADKYAVGTSASIINVEALQRVIDYIGKADYSEYMTWYFKNNPDIFKINKVSLPDELVRDYRLTLDYPEDLEMFKELFAKIDSENPCISATDIFSVLDHNSRIAKLNQVMELRYVSDKDLIETLNKNTRIIIDR